MNGHHKRAVQVIIAAVTLDVVLGVLYAVVTPGLPVWHGIYNALANAVTDGGDVPARTPLGYVITAVEYATVVPLFAATYSFFTSGLSSSHVKAAAEDVKQHVTRQVTNGCS